MSDKKILKNITTRESSRSLRAGKTLLLLAFISIPFLSAWHLHLKPIDGKQAFALQQLVHKVAVHEGSTTAKVWSQVKNDFGVNGIAGVRQTSFDEIAINLVNRSVGPVVRD